MPISKPILVALVAAVLALGAFYATMGARSSDETPQGPANATDRSPASPTDRSPATPKDSGQSKADAKAQSRPRSESAADKQRSTDADARASAKPGIPAAVAGALAGGRTVVLFFHGRGSDDAATAKAVSALRGRGGTRVFSAPISRLADYSVVTAGAGVSQAPAVVILRKGRSARLVEGFVDAETLTQHVADTR